MKKSLTTILALGLAIVGLVFIGCGGTSPSASSSPPVISDQQAETLSLASDDGEAHSSDRTWGYNLAAVVYRLRTVCAPLFQHYGITFGEDFEESSAYAQMMSEVSFVVQNGVVTVTNKATGGVIFTGSLDNLSAGVFTDANIPGSTTTPPSSPPPPPPVCTGWTTGPLTPATCPASGQQTQTVTAVPAGCTGTPPGTQPPTTVSCTPPPPPPPTNPVTSANIVSSCTGCHGLTSNTTVFKSGGYTVTGRSSAQWLTSVNNMVGLGASLAPGTTAQNYADYLANAP